MPAFFSRILFDRCSRRELLLLFLLTVSLLLVSLLLPAVPAALAAPPSSGPNGAGFDEQIALLAARAPGVETLQASFRLDSVSTVDGFDSRYTQEGRVFYDRGALAIYRELTSGVLYMQLIYADGELQRYFPVNGYGHRIVAGSWDKDKTDFARFWRPLLAHLDPGTVLKTVAGPGRVRRDGAAIGLEFRPDRHAELAARPDSPTLEYWGPPPDVDVHVDSEHRVARVERTLYRTSRADRQRPEIVGRSTAQLTERTVHSGVLLPTRVLYEALLDGQGVPYRSSQLDLFDVAVNQSLPADAFAPGWPADALLLDVEPQKPAAYLPHREDPVAQIMLADYYLGTGQANRGLEWLETFQTGFADRRPSAPEAGHLARLLALAERKEDGRQVHLRAIRDAQNVLAASAGNPELELELGRYYTEYAFFLAFSVGKRLHEQAGRFLEGKIGDFETPAAGARLAAAAASQYAMARRFELAEDVLAAAEDLIGGDAEAAAWLEGGRRQVLERYEQNQYWQHVRAKNKKVRELETRLADLDGSDDATAEERAELERRLTLLMTRP